MYLINFFHSYRLAYLKLVAISVICGLYLVPPVITAEDGQILSTIESEQIRTQELLGSTVSEYAIEPAKIVGDVAKDNGIRVAKRETRKAQGHPHKDQQNDVQHVFGDVLSELGVVSDAKYDSLANEIDEFLTEQTASPPPKSNKPKKAQPKPINPRLAAKPKPKHSEQKPAEPLKSTANPTSVKITSQMRSLQYRIQQCLSVYKRLYLNTDENGCWSTLHSILGLGAQGRIHIGGPKGNTTNALRWICDNQPCANRRLFYVDNGRIHGREGAGYQGHPAQFLAVLAQIQIPVDYPLSVEGHKFTVQDLIETEKRTCKEHQELTFKLIALSHYLNSDQVWTSDDGQEWNIPRLIKEELNQPVNGAACGGTHRIMAISYAALKRKHRGEAIEGQWWRANKYMKDYQNYTFSLQNRDGSFSSDWFKNRSDWGDIDRQLQTTGHILEWLVFSLSDEQLSSPRVTRSVAFLTNLMIANRFHDWEKGPRGHAIRALDLYYRRVFGDFPEISQRPIIQEFRDQTNDKQPRVRLFRKFGL